MNRFTAIQVTLAAFATALGLQLAAARPVRAADELLFCNRPERIRMGGTHAETRLKAGRTYRIFFHYKNNTKVKAPLVVALKGEPGQSVSILTRKGIADPQRDPPNAGRQAMARFLKAPQRRYGGRESVRFPIMLKPGQIASGVLLVRVESPERPPVLEPAEPSIPPVPPQEPADGQKLEQFGREEPLEPDVLEPAEDPEVPSVRLWIYFRHNRYTVPGARVVSVPSPRRDYQVVLSPKVKRCYFRIGVPEPGMSRHLDGAYGQIYSFKVSAPAGRKVRVAFSPRGGQGGLVGTVDGKLRQSRIVGATAWTVFADAVVSKKGLVITTLPFGGVFYPVELTFQLL